MLSFSHKKKFSFFPGRNGFSCDDAYSIPASLSHIYLKNIQDRG